MEGLLQTLLKSLRSGLPGIGVEWLRWERSSHLLVLRAGGGTYRAQHTLEPGESGIDSWG